MTGIVLGVNALSDRVNGFQRVNVPGTGVVTFDDGGDYTMYYETAGGLGDYAIYFDVVGVTGDSSVTPTLTVNLEPAPDNSTAQKPSLDPYAGSFTYSVGDHNGLAIATFDIDEPGSYALTSTGSLESGTGRLAVGKGSGARLAGRCCQSSFF